MDNVVSLQIAVVAVAVVCVAVLLRMRAMKRRHEETVARREADAEKRVQQASESAAKELAQKIQESQVAHKAEFGAKRIILTHMSREMLAHADEVPEECAFDGMVVEI